MRRKKIGDPPLHAKKAPIIFLLSACLLPIAASRVYQSYICYVESHAFLSFSPLVIELQSCKFYSKFEHSGH